MMNGVKTIEDIYRERSDVDQALDKVADPLQPADYNQLADLLSGAVIDECSFVYESAEDKSPAAIRMKCISSDGSEYFLQFGYDAFSDQAFSAFFHDPPDEGVSDLGVCSRIFFSHISKIRPGWR